MAKQLVWFVLVVHIVMAMVSVVAEVFVQMIRIDRDLHHIQLVPIGIEHKQAHALPFGMNEDQRLLCAPAAGLANDSLPPLAKLALHQLVEFIAIHRRIEVFKLRDVQIAHPATGRLARNHADQAHERNVRGTHVIPVLDRVNHAVKAALSAAGQHRYRNQQQNQTYGNEQEPSHQSPPFLSLSLALPCGVCCTPPSAPKPPSPCSLPRSSMRMGPRISTIVNSLGSTTSTNMP